MMPNFNPMTFAMQMLRNNPQVSNSPMGQSLIQALQSGDQKAGEQLAMNICQSYGLTKEQALQQAMNGFNLGGFQR